MNTILLLICDLIDLFIKQAGELFWAIIYHSYITKIMIYLKNNTYLNTKSLLKIISSNISNSSKFCTNISKNAQFKHMYRFSVFPRSQSIFSQDTQPQMFKLQQEYKLEQNLNIFQEFITKSTGMNDQMTIFKIFKVMETSTFNQNAYIKLFNLVNKCIGKKKSDNMLLLLANVKKRIALNHKNHQNYSDAIKCLEQALEILEYSMVPPLFPYYSIYRQYGLIHDIIGESQKAKQILTQTVEILDDFVSNSDDAVSTNDYCMNMASSYNCLARIDPQNKSKWTQRAEEAWKGFTQSKYSQVEYAKTVSLNVQKLIKQDREKGQAYYHFNLYKFENKELKDLIKKAKQQALL